MSEVQDIIELAKRRGFFWPSYSIYGGVSGFYTYGPLGSLLKRNVIRSWADAYLSIGAIMVESPVVSPESVFRASGHLERFNDLIYECSRCGNRQKFESLLKEEEKGREFDQESAQGYVRERKLQCSSCRSDRITVKEYSLMFPLGKNDKAEERLYLRPETAQGIFLDFQLLLNQNRGKLPMIVIQTGGGFRNEVAPRNALVRLREFSMGEVEVFIDPETEPFRPDASYGEVHFLDNKGKVEMLSPFDASGKGVVRDPAMAYFIQRTHMLLVSLGVDPERLRFRQHLKSELAHYSSDCWDAEALMDGDWLEIVGIADRGTYDLKRHGDVSGTSMEVRDGERKFIPRVIEPAHGIDRIVMAIMAHSRKVTGRGYVVMSFRNGVAPYHVGIFPLFKKDGLAEIARELYRNYSSIDAACIYDESGSIGKRYARQDEAGTPYCITVDYETRNDKAVTVRERDTGKQVRISIEELTSVPILQNAKLAEKFSQ
ncbi:MAG: glycine--tRNA ligase [Candidatus Thermoplasmatota archaeon]|nr:glycine--tRNA ligase [Candidatus Thermoplasmatota archaeon]